MMQGHRDQHIWQAAARSDNVRTQQVAQDPAFSKLPVKL
jgi:hypothetical protein